METTQNKNTKAFNRITSISTSYFEGEKELSKRVEFVRTVIKNTLHKFPKELWPEELEWVIRGGKYTGFEFRDFNDKVVEITAENPINRRHTFHFYIIGRKSYLSSELQVRKASFPAELLFNDPMAIAQYARNLIRQKQTKIRLELSADANRKLEDVAKKIAQLNVEREKLEQQKRDINVKSQQAREAVARNRAKAEKRRAAKLQKTQS